MELAVDRAFMPAEIFGRDEYQVVDVESNREMGSILELVQYVTPQVGHVPAHTKRGKRAQHATRVELPAVVGIIQVAMWSKVIAGDHRTYLHPTYYDIERSCHFRPGSFIIIVVWSHCMPMLLHGQLRLELDRHAVLF